MHIPEGMNNDEKHRKTALRVSPVRSFLELIACIVRATGRDARPPRAGGHDRDPAAEAAGSALHTGVPLSPHSWRSL